VPEAAPDPVDLAPLEERLGAVERALRGVSDPGVRARVLEERARAIAPSREETVVDSVPVLAFRVGGERYAVEVRQVFEVVEARSLSPLPASPPWLLGAIVARTRVVPVLDLRQLLGLEGGGLNDLGKVVVVEHDGETFGLAAEVVEGRLEVPKDALAAPAGGPFGWIGPDRLALLDLGRLGAPGARG
jgi:purine-binding chemotaxis protein CheW